MTRLLVSCISCLSCISWLTIAAQTPDRSKPPALGPPPQLKLPQIQKRALPNGLAVWLIESREVPLAQINLLVQAGTADDPAGKYGVASLTAAMLDEGAGTLPSLEIADAVDFLGADLSVASTADSSSVRLNVPVARLAEALPIMADVALRPTFPEKDLERLKKERLTSLLQVQDDPDAIASIVFSRRLFGAAHRYGTIGMGTPSTVGGLTADDLRKFHAAYFTPQNAALVVVGDVRMDVVMPFLEQQFGAWKGTTPARAVRPAAAQSAKREITIVDKPGAEQSEIRIGWIGVPRSTPDYFTLVTMNTVLGGSFTSRLNQNLREKHGYAYGASSAFDMRLSAGPFLARAAVQADKTAESTREFFNELEAIRRPIANDELTRAKNYLALGLPADFETSGDLSRRIEEMIVYQLAENYFEQYVPKIQAVTPEAVAKAAATYIQPAKFIVVVVGDRKTIEAPIRALKLGPVNVMSVQEALPQ